jgi:hypothetical protein
LDFAKEKYEEIIDISEKNPNMFFHLPTIKKAEEEIKSLTSEIDKLKKEIEFNKPEPLDLTKFVRPKKNSIIDSLKDIWDTAQGYFQDRQIQIFDEAGVLEQGKALLDLFLSSTGFLQLPIDIDIDQAKDELDHTRTIFHKFFDSVGMEFEEQKSIFQDWSKGFTESLADSLMEGKSMFDDFFKSVMKQLLELQIQKSITNPLFEGLGLLPGKAIGGPVTAGSPYIVGEKGPELFMPNSSGTIIPNNKLSGSSAPSKDSSVQVNIINNAPAEVSTTERTDGNGNQILDVTINAVKNEWQEVSLTMK